MSKRLKTLNNLEEEHSYNPTGCEGDDEINLNAWEWSDVIRDAAREWIKELRKYNNVGDDETITESEV